MKRRTQDFLREHPEATDQLMKELSKKDNSEAWREKLLVGADGKSPYALLANAITALRDCPVWRDRLAFNDFSLRAVIMKPTPWGALAGTIWEDEHDSCLAEWLQHQGIKVNSKLAGEAMHVVAREHRFNPILKYLDGREWDGKPRLETWLSTYIGAEDNPYVRAVGTRWLISGIARIRKPGCKADFTLVLEGPQGRFKSTSLQVLAGDDWFTDHLSDLSSKDSRIELHGVWIVEMAELAALKRSETERMKSFLTAKTDHFRPPYGHRATHVPRTNIFAATTNESSYLIDPTGARRFWPVRCGRIDIDRLTRDRDQLWAEADALYQAGASWWLESDELTQLATTEQSDRYEAGVWDELILTWIANPKQARDSAKDLIEPFTSVHSRVSITDVLQHGVRKPIDRCTQADRNVVARCLSHYGYERRQSSRAVNGQRPWFYCPKEEGTSNDK